MKKRIVLMSIALAAAFPLDAAEVKIIIPNDESGSTKSSALADGAKFIADRGSYSVYGIDTSDFSQFEARYGATARPDFETIHLNRGTMNMGGVSRQSARMATTTARAAVAVGDLKIIQFAAPPSQEERDSLLDAGCSIVQYVPENAYLVWTTEGSQLDSLPLVNGVMEYEPDFALSPHLDEARHQPSSVAVTISLFDDGQSSTVDLDTIINDPELAILGAPLVGIGRNLILITVSTPGTKLDQLAALPSVVFIEPTGTPNGAGEPSNQIISSQTKVVGGKVVQQNPVEDGVGYLDFLRNRLGILGDSDDPLNYPVAVVVDTGVDNGGNATDPAVPNPTNPDFRQEGDVTKDSRLVFSQRWDHIIDTLSYTADQVTFNHGNYVASMLGGYNDGVGVAFEDVATGLNWGLGASPFGRIASQKIADEFYPVLPFAPGVDPSGNFDAADIASTIESLYTQTLTVNAANPGAKEGVIANNSWIIVRPTDCLNPGDNPTGSFYDQYAMLVDMRTRDALPDVQFPEHPGNQETLFVFAAGNAGYTTLVPIPDECCFEGVDVANCFPIPRLNTVASPGLSKNVVTVGGSENVDPRLGIPASCDFYPDCCYLQIQADNGTADNAGDVAYLGSKGSPNPLDRVKPDIIAPASRVYANKFEAGGFCPDDNVAGTSAPQEYERIWGTSFSAPIVSGAAQVFASYLERQYSLSNASAALQKAYLIHTGKFLRGEFSGPYNEVSGMYEPAPLPSPYQGFGLLDMDMGMDHADRYFVNQSVVFDDLGDVFNKVGYIPDPSKPVRFALVWTDPAAVGNVQMWRELVNDLDLFVSTVSIEPGQGFPIKFRHFVGNEFQSTPGAEDLSLPLGTGVIPPVSTLLNNADRVNNIEAVFLPNQAFGTVASITVKPFALNMDALDLTAMTARQDFALVAYNFVPLF